MVEAGDGEVGRLQTKQDLGVSLEDFGFYSNIGRSVRRDKRKSSKRTFRRLWGPSR